MKKLITLLALTGVLLTSCSSDDKNKEFNYTYFGFINSEKVKLVNSYILENGQMIPYKQNVYWWDNKIDNYSVTPIIYYYPQGYWDN